MSRPDGLVDPCDPDEVVPVLAAALRSMGADGLVDLLTRLPGVRREEARPKRLFTAAVPGLLWIGSEDRMALSEPLLHEHVVGGVVLDHTPLPPGDLPGVLAQVIARHVRREAVEDDAAVALTAVRDLDF